MANAFSSAPSADGTFAATFGRALEVASDPTGSSSPRASRTSPAFPGSAHPKDTASKSPESASLAATAFACFLSNIVQPPSSSPWSADPALSATGAPACDTASNQGPRFSANSASLDANPQSITGAVSLVIPIADDAGIATTSAKTGGAMKPGEVPSSASAAQPGASIRERHQAGTTATDFNAASGPWQTPEAPTSAVGPLPDSLSSIPGPHGVDQHADSQRLEIASAPNQLVAPDPAFGQARSDSAWVSGVPATTVAAGDSEPAVFPGPDETAASPLTGQATDDVTAETQWAVGAPDRRFAESASSSSPEVSSAAADFTDGHDPAVQFDQTTSASDTSAAGSSQRTFSTGHPQVDGLSKLSGHFEVEAIGFKSPKTGSAHPSITESAQHATMGSESVTAVGARPRLRAASTAEGQVSAEIKVESPNHRQSQTSNRLANTPGHASAELADKEGPKPEIALTQTVNSIPPDTGTPQPAEPRLQSTAGAGEVRKPAEPEPSPAHDASGAVRDDLNSPVTVANSAAGSQEKSGQQSGMGSRGNPSAVTPIERKSANNAPSSPDPVVSAVAVNTATVPAGHATRSVSSGAATAPQPSTTLSAWQNYEGGAGSIVRSASLTSSVNAAELRVEFRSGALGPMEVHAIMHEGSLGAEIHVQGQEAHSLLAAGLPSLERALVERNLRVENIAVYQDNAGAGAGGGDRQDSHAGSSSSPRQERSPWADSPASGSMANGVSEDEILVNPALGLSIQA